MRIVFHYLPAQQRPRRQAIAMMKCCLGWSIYPHVFSQELMCWFLIFIICLSRRYSFLWPNPKGCSYNYNKLSGGIKSFVAIASVPASSALPVMQVVSTSICMTTEHRCPPPPVGVEREAGRGGTMAMGRTGARRRVAGAWEEDGFGESQILLGPDPPPLV